jgi:hypothetical protein
MQDTMSTFLRHLRSNTKGIINPSVSVQEDILLYWSLVIIDSLVYGLTAGLAIFPVFPFRIRAILAVCLFYAMGVSLLFSPHGYITGPLWLFAFPVINGVLLGFRPAVFALAADALVLVVSGIFMAKGILNWGLDLQNMTARWVIISIDFIFVNLVVTISISSLVRRPRNLWGDSQNLVRAIREELDRHPQKVN